MRDAVDVSVPTTIGIDADGQVVWSWPPDAEAKFRGRTIREAMGAREPGSQGEREVSRKPLRREGRMFPP